LQRRSRSRSRSRCRSRSQLQRRFAAVVAAVACTCRSRPRARSRCVQVRHTACAAPGGRPCQYDRHDLPRSFLGMSERSVGHSSARRRPSSVYLSVSQPASAVTVRGVRSHVGRPPGERASNGGTAAAFEAPASNMNSLGWPIDRSIHRWLVGWLVGWLVWSFCVSVCLSVCR